MGRHGGQSPEKLLPDRGNRSDRNPMREESTMSSTRQGFSFAGIQIQSPPPPWYGSMSPTQHTSPPITTAADGIPLYPILQIPYNAHHNILDPNPNHLINNTGVGGIMALTNFGFSGTTNNKSRGNTPPSRKFTFNLRSPQIAPVNTSINDNHVRTPPGPQTPHDQHHGLIQNFRGYKLHWLIPTVIMVNSLMLVITMYENNCRHTALHPNRCVLKFLGRLSFQPFNENPLLGPSWKALLNIGALNSNLVTNNGQGWRLLTAVWLHAGLFHLIANMFGLLSIGRRLEEEFGWIRVTIIYVIAGFGGSLLSTLFMHNQISVGASGALMGLLGATVAELLINWSASNNNNNQLGKSLAALLLMVTVNLSFGLMPHVDNFAHIGGLCAGSLLGFILLMKPRSTWMMNQPWIIGPRGLGGEVPTTSRLKHTNLQNVARFVALGFLVFSYGMGMLALFRGYGWGARKTCKWCKYMSCVPSFLWQCYTHD